MVKTGFQHNELSDRGPESVKASIEAKVHSFLDEEEKRSSPFGQLTAAAPNPSVTTTNSPRAARFAQ